MKKLFTKQTISFVFTFLLITSFLQLNAQVSGDYRSNATTMNWNTAGSWQTYNGSTWGTASSAPGSSNSVYIQSGHTITLTQNESCNDLHIATGTTGISPTLLGKIALSTFTLSVNGKLRCYTGTVGTIPGTSSTAGYSIYPFTIGTGGKVSIVGTTRNITNTGEWSGTVSTASTGAFPLEINMNTTSDTAKPQTSIKATSFVIARGVLNASTSRMAPDNATAGQGDFTVNSGGTFRSAQSGTASGSQVISRTGSSRSGALIVNSGGRVILSGTTPCIDVNSVTNNGTFEFAGGNLTTPQSFARKSGLDASAVDFSTYNDVVLNTTATSLPKTLTVNATINGKLTLQDSGRFAISTFTLTYGASASLEYLSTTIGQTTSSTEWPASGSQPSIVSMNNSANVTLGASTNIPAGGRLALVSGKLLLGTNSLTMSGSTSAFSTSASSASPLSFGSSYSSYIVTNSTGVLTIASIGTGGRTGDILFPIGVSTTIYNPVVLNASSAASSFSLSTISGSIPKVSAAQSLNNYWIVSGTGIATVKGQWNASDEGGSFDRTNARMVSFNSGLISATSATSSGSAPYTYSGSSYSSFNNFGIMSGLANEPTQVSSLSFSNLQSTSFDVSWNNGNGTNRIVLVKAVSAVDANPVDGTTYTANTTFGNGSQIGSGNYVVYNGTGNTASISGLTNGTTYFVAVYEFNGVDGIINYNTTSPATGDPYSPSIVVSSSSLSAFSNTALGSSSNNQTFTVSGSYLDDDITLSAPSGFEISTSSSSGFGNSVVLTRNSGTVSTTTIYARFTPTTTGNASGNIAISSTNSTTQNVAVSGVGIAEEPTTQATVVNFTTVGATAMTINWTSGNGANRLVVVKQGSAVTGTPADATTYTANTAFGSGSTIATGEYVVYGCCGGGSSVTVTNLNPNTTYYVAVFEFNGSGGSENYLITSPATGNQLTNNTSYRSVATGNWSSASSWEISSDASTWSAASSAPTFTDGPITIRSGHNITSNAAVTVDQLTVALGGTLTISSGMTINNGSGTDISCDGIIVSSTGTPFTINSGAAIQINSGGRYQHNSNSGGIPTCTWASGSTCEVVGFTSGTPTSATLNQSFHHFTWNCASQSGAIGLSAGLTTINGNFTVSNTNGQQLRLTGSNAGTLNIGGNFVIGNGTNSTVLAPSSSSGAMTINISGDLIINNNGQLNETSGTSGGKFTMTVSGNLDCSGGGTILTTSTSSNTLTLAGSSLTTKSINMGSGSHNFNKCDLSIGNGSTSCVYQVVGNNLVFNTSNSSARTFIIASLATLDLNGFTLSLDNSGSTTGSITGAGSLTANATGSTVNYASSGTQTIRAYNYFNLTSSSTGSRTFAANTTGNVVIQGTFTKGTNTYNTSVSQVVFNGNVAQTIPSLSYDNIVVDNSAGCTISGTTTMDSLSLANGTLNLGTDSLTVTGNVTRTNGSLNASTGTLRLTAAGGNLILPATTFVGNVYRMAVASSSNYVQLGENTTLSNDLNLVSGILRVGANTLTLNGTFTSASGVLRGSTSSDVSIGGSGTFGTLMMDQSSTSSLNTNNIRNLVINRNGATINMGNSLKVNSTGTLTLTSGTLAVQTNTLTMNGAISLGTGIINASTGTVAFGGSSAQNIPSGTFSSNSIANLAVSNTSGVTINNSFTITTNLNFPTSGIINTGSNKVIIASGATLTGGGTGWVNGNLQRNISSGNNVAVTFDIGDASNYLPVVMNFATVSASGDVTASIYKPFSDVPNYNSAPANNTNYIDRYWRMTNENTLSFNTYSVTLNYLNSDKVGNAIESSVICPYYISSWAVTTTSAGTNANTISGITGIANFLLTNECIAVTPSITISTAATSICSGSNTTFTAVATNGGSSPSYQWKKNGVDAGSGSTITFLSNTLSNGDVISCVLTANNNCQTTATANSNSIQMTVKQSPSVAQITNGISAITTASLCTLGSTYRYYDATPYGTWSSSNPSVASVTGGSQAGVVTANTNGTATISYNVTATNGCVSTSSVLLTVAQQTAPTAISGTNSICVNATTALSSTAPVGTTGVWSSSSNRGIISVGGVYTGQNAGTGEARYTVTNTTTGCKAFTSYSITVNPTPVVPTITYAPGTVGNPQAGAPTGGFCVGKKFRVVATPNVPAGVWSATGAASFAGYDTVKINAVGAGSIKYTYTSAAGCASSRIMSATGYTCASRGVLVSGEGLVVSGDFTMYPNPAKGSINLNVETLIGAGSIVVTDLYGKSVKTQNLSMGTNTVNISNLSKGMYFVSTITSEGKITKKLIVE